MKTFKEQAEALAGRDKPRDAGGLREGASVRKLCRGGGGQAAGGARARLRADGWVMRGWQGQWK